MTNSAATPQPRRGYDYRLREQVITTRLDHTSPSSSVRSKDRRSP